MSSFTTDGILVGILVGLIVFSFACFIGLMKNVDEEKYKYLKYGGPVAFLFPGVLKPEGKKYLLMLIGTFVGVLSLFFFLHN